MRYAPVVRLSRRQLNGGCNFTRPATIEVDCAEEFLDLIAPPRW